MTMNFGYTGHSLVAGTYYTHVINGAAYKEVLQQILIEGVTGTPTTGSITATFQVGALEYGSYTLDWQPSGDVRDWLDVLTTTPELANLITTDWPSPIVTESIGTGTKIVVNKLKLGAPLLWRLKLVVAFSGGTAPAFKVSTSSIMT